MCKKPLILLLALLAGCGYESAQAREERENQEYLAEVEAYFAEKEAAIAANLDEHGRKILDHKGNRLRWVDDYNYYTEFDDGTPPYAHVNKASIWPLEDVTDPSSYDMPRMQFVWQNNHNAEDIDEWYDKVFSIKADGTDLRLVVSQEFSWGGFYSPRRSPDNRYLAYGQCESGRCTHYVLDLLKQERVELGVGVSPRFIWAEDSSYVYYQTERDHAVKYTLATGEHEKLDYTVGNGVIFEGKRYQIGHIGVAVNDEHTNEKLLQINNFPEGDEDELHYYIMRAGTTFSPDGKFAWGSSGFFNFWFDLEQGTVTRVPADNKHFHNLKMITLGGEYVLSATFSASVLSYNSAGVLKRAGSAFQGFRGGTSPSNHTLYNAFANNGNVLELEVAQ
ncbi:hypothetical protein [Vibrio sp. WXL210]|uniref:hypothetical protein n=1 Tax=Vibrio sp. WXL210 TaxID=3450709 RepID=UPI003EC4ED53